MKKKITGGFTMTKLRARQAVAFLVSFLMVLSTAENLLLAQDVGTYLAPAELSEIPSK